MPRVIVRCVVVVSLETFKRGQFLDALIRTYPSLFVIATIDIYFLDAEYLVIAENTVLVCVEVLSEIVPER